MISVTFYPRMPFDKLLQTCFGIYICTNGVLDVIKATSDSIKEVYDSELDECLFIFFKILEEDTICKALFRKTTWFYDERLRRSKLPCDMRSWMKYVLSVKLFMEPKYEHIKLINTIGKFYLICKWKRKRRFLPNTFSDGKVLSLIDNLIKQHVIH
jgi:hypothetical protein